MEIKVSIVTGTYNRLDWLRKMIDSVRRSVGNLSYEIIAVDGGSTDGTLDFLYSQKDVQVIEHGELRGAIAAINDGCRQAKGKYVVISNDDIEYLDSSIARAYQFMIEHPDVGIGCFEVNRNKRDWHVAIMPAHTRQGQMTSVPYGGLVIIPTWLGNELQWWTLPGARTYGGDNALCARCFEAGFDVVSIPGARVNEPDIQDELKKVNNPPTSDNHPDTQAYLKLFPHGPVLGNPRRLIGPEGYQPTLRILYAPIYEERHTVQHAQKNGLRRALQRRGIVHEVDYQTLGPEAILDESERFKPHLVLTQLHYPEPFTPDHARRLRGILPNSVLVNWNGDVYPRAKDPKYGTDYLRLLGYFDLQTVVNASDIPNYEAVGIPAIYWQNAYEPEGVGYEPDAGTPRSDIVFLGNGYSAARQEFATFLQSLPFVIRIHGEHWPPGVAAQGTLYDFRRGCQLYRASKISLGDAEWTHEAKGFVSNRLFQVMAAGGALMMQQDFAGREELLGLQNGIHLVLWKKREELPELFKYYLTHEKERQRIVRAGQNVVLAKHSFEARLNELWPHLKRKPDPTNTDPTLTIFHEGYDG